MEKVHTEENVHHRRDLLHKATGHPLPKLTSSDLQDPDEFRGNIENYIGMAQIPVGIAGPLHVIGGASKGNYYIPLATTEGALVASYNRGMKACQARGIRTLVVDEAVQRCPLFKFETLDKALAFLQWTHAVESNLKSLCREHSNYAQLKSLSTHLEGNTVTLTLGYTTGDAAGQNMVTICTNALCHYLLDTAPVAPVAWYIEGNFSGDKKATQKALLSTRGKKVIAEAIIDRETVQEVLKTTPEAIEDYWRDSTVANLQSGAIGAQGHVANALTALFIACGQDVACVAEASAGVTRFEGTPEGNLYVSLTLPNLIVGTVGGGTSLPTQRECLELLGCYGPGKARTFAELCTATALCGELSIAAALSAQHFVKAHQKLGRK